MSRILIATDFSSQADRASEAGLRWARRLGSEVHFAHAVEHLAEASPPSAAPLISSYVEKARAHGTTQLATAVEAARAQGLEATAHVVDAPAARSVVALARELAASCVVVGPRGHNALQKLVLGSVAQRVVREAPCSVLVARGDGAAPGEGPVVLGDDLSEQTEPARAEAIQVAGELGQRLHVVHVPELGIPYFSSLGFALPGQLLDQIRDEAAKALDALFSQRAQGVGLEPVIVRDKPSHAICRHAREVGAGLVVVGTSSPSGIERVLLGSVADGVAQHASCSVLVVR